MSDAIFLSVSTRPIKRFQHINPNYAQSDFCIRSQKLNLKLAGSNYRMSLQELTAQRLLQEAIALSDEIKAVSTPFFADFPSLLDDDLPF